MLLSLLLRKAGIYKPNDWLDSLFIFPMDDGKMGSYYITQELSTEIASDILFLDEDSVEVLASLYVSEQGDPCEVDIWKMDYSELMRIPKILKDIRD